MSSTTGWWPRGTDVHDVLGHSLIIVMMQLTAARHLLRRDLEKTDAALADAERVARESLNQVRRTLGLLRRGGNASTEDVGVPSINCSPTTGPLEFRFAPRSPGQ